MPSITSEIVQVCVFRLVNDAPVFLLLKRAEDVPLYPNIWQFVTGRIHEGEKATDAALRELREETGLSPLKIWVVPHVNEFYDAEKDAIHLSPLFAVQVADNPVLSHEHSAYEWLPLEDAIQRLVWPGQRAGMRIVCDYIISTEKASELSRLRNS